MKRAPRRAAPAYGLALLAVLAGGVAVRAAAPAVNAGKQGEAPSLPVQSVAVVLEPPTLTVGDPVIATLTLVLAGADAAREATFPDWSKGWGDAEVLSASAVESSTSPDGVRWVQRLELTTFRPGTTALPPVAVRLSGEPERRAATPQNLALEVRSVIPLDDKERKAAPPSPPRSLAVPRSFWWTLAAGGTLAALAALVAWQMQRRRAAEDPLAAPQLSPSAELERALGLLQVEPPETAFRSLSHALRRYLGRRLAFRALESTTTEVQRRLAAQRFDPALIQRTVRLLRLADQIKFAMRPAEETEVAARIAETRELAAAVESHLAPAVELATASSLAAGTGNAA